MSSTSGKSRPLSTYSNRKTHPYRSTQNSPVHYNPKKVTSYRSTGMTQSYHSPYHYTPFKNTVVTKIPSYLDKSKRAQLSQLKKTQEKQNSPLIDDPKCIALRDQLFEGGNIDEIEIQELKNLSEHLREYSAVKTSERDYEEAKKANEYYCFVREEIQIRMNDVNTKKANDSCSHLVKEKEEEFKKQLDKFDQETEEKRKIIEMKQNEETENFEKKWTEEIPQTYRKQSGKLLQLFEIERRLGLCNEFDKAQEAKQQADLLEKKEIEEAQRNMENDYKMAKMKLEQEHQNEIEHFEKTREHHKDCLIALQKEEMSKVENRMLVLQTRQQQYSKPKESSFDIQTRGSVNSSLTTIKRSNRNDVDSAKLLPPLIPPNDPRVKERRQQEQKDLQLKKKKFQEHMEQKQKEKDRSAPTSPREMEESRYKDDKNYEEMLQQLDKMARNEIKRKSEYQPRSARLHTQRALQVEKARKSQRNEYDSENEENESSSNSRSSKSTRNNSDNEEKHSDDENYNETHEENLENNEKGNEEGETKLQMNTSEVLKTMIKKVDIPDDIENSPNEDGNKSNQSKKEKDDGSVKRTDPDMFNLTQAEQYKAKDD